MYSSVIFPFSTVTGRHWPGTWWSQRSNRCQLQWYMSAIMYHTMSSPCTGPSWAIIARHVCCMSLEYNLAHLNVMTTWMPLHRMTLSSPGNTCLLHQSSIRLCISMWFENMPAFAPDHFEQSLQHMSEPVVLNTARHISVIWKHGSPCTGLLWAALTTHVCNSSSE